MKFTVFKSKSRWLQITSIILLISFFTSCTNIVKEYTNLFGPSSPKERVLTTVELNKNNHISFLDEVPPILTNRCAVCHSCNDAPCQLNFTSMKGIDRGASIETVYNGARFSQQDPSRLGIDASTTQQWRERNFFPVLNERRQEEKINLQNSLLYKVLVAKKPHLFPIKWRLAEEYKLGVKLTEDESFLHGQVCLTIEKYSVFSQKNPQWGMPFALPPITNNEFKTIETWLKQGAKVEAEKPLSKKFKQEIKKWEKFLNASSNKERLMSKYIYEHLFLGYLYFKDVSETDFFMLVRSGAPSGKAIEIINTIRPYNALGVADFFYRIKHYNRVIVDKTHLPYALNDKRMTRYNEFFLKPDYTVDNLPSYDLEQSANPFKTFAVIPPHKSLSVFT